MKSDFKHWLRFPTRFRDMDAMRHVNSAVYFTYFEIVRMDYFYAIQLEDMKVQGKIGPAVVRQACNYRQQVFHPAEIEAGVRTTKMSEKSFTVEYEFYLADTETLVADGETVMVWVDFQIPKAIPLPGELRRNIEAREGHSF